MGDDVTQVVGAGARGEEHVGSARGQGPATVHELSERAQPPDCGPQRDRGSRPPDLQDNEGLRLHLHAPLSQGRVLHEGRGTFAVVAV